MAIRTLAAKVMPIPLARKDLEIGSKVTEVCHHLAGPRMQSDDTYTNLYLVPKAKLRNKYDKIVPAEEGF